MSALDSPASGMAERTAWAPRVAMSTIAVAAFFALIVLPRTAMPLVDGDVWWHLHAGETILDTGRVPTVDSWTLVGSGMRWISQDWASNTVMAAVLRAFGPWGDTALSLLFAGLVVLAFAWLWRAVSMHAPASGWLGRLVWLTAGLVVAAPVLGVRVQTVDLVMTSATAWVLWRYLADPRLRWVLAMPLIAVIWVNTHAGFPLLFAFGGAVAVGEAIDRLLHRPVSPGPLAWRQIAWLAGGLLVAFAVLVINPNGMAIYGYPFATAGIQAHRDFIFEWSRPDLTSLPGQLLYALIVLGVVPTFLVARRSMRTADALWLLGATALGLMAIRFVLVLGPIAGIMAACYLAPWIGHRWGSFAGPVLARMARVPRSAAQRWTNAVLLMTVLLLGAGVAVARVTPAAEQSAIAEAMPVAATDWLRANAPEARLFNVYAWGGWLGRELPHAKVYIDGRSDIYGDAPIRAFADAVELKTDPGVLLDRYHVDHVVYWPDSALAGWLDTQPGWERVHADAQAVIWERVQTG